MTDVGSPVVKMAEAELGDHEGNIKEERGSLVIVDIPHNQIDLNGVATFSSE